MRSLFFFIVSAVITIAAVHLTFTTFIEFSGFAAGFAKAVIAIALFVFADRFLLTEINTITELKNGNIAYAIFCLAYALLVGLCVSTA
jgi:hypothetical protein